MSIITRKKNLLDQIAAIKSLTSGFPELNLGNSFPSLNNNSNTVDFLLDLIKTIIGFEDLKKELIVFLTYQTNAIEGTIKKLLKEILKKYFSCSTDALIPSSLINLLGDGFNISVSQVDFFNILKTDPNSQEGSLVYGSVQQDLNTFLWQVLQGTPGTWKSLLVVEYLQQGLVDGQMRTNVFNIKIDSSWKGKTVNDFINKFVDSVIIFTIPQFVNKLLDSLFGVISNLLGKSKPNVENEITLEILVQKIVDLPDTVIDDSYYEFSQEDINYFNERVEERTNGERILKDCNFVSSTVNSQTIIDTYEQLESASTLIEIEQILSNQFTIMSNEAADNLGTDSQTLGQLNFFQGLFKSIILGLVNLIFAPKIMFLFVTYFKIVNSTVGFVDFKSFLEQNRQFIVDIIRETLMPIFIDFLLKLVIKYVTKLVISNSLGRSKEMIKNYQLQLASLVGIPKEIRDLISNI